MPCNFISSCFFTESPWSRTNGGAADDANCVTGAAAAAAREDQQQPGDRDWRRGAGPQFDPEDPDAEAVGVDPPAPVDRQPRLPPGQADMAGTSTQNSEAANQAANNNSSNVTSKVPRVAKTFRAYLPSACHRTYSCVHCRAHLANHDELISKSFQGSQGRAYLFNSVVNIGCGPAEERVLLTGLHAVADIYCDCCKTTLGWKYEQAYESSQKYKEGKFIIELAHMIKENGWENES